MKPSQPLLSVSGHYVPFTPKADMCNAARDVRYGPIADIAERIGRVRFAPKAGIGHFSLMPPADVRSRALIRGSLASSAGVATSGFGSLTDIVAVVEFVR